MSCAVVFENRGLAGVEAVGLCPAKAEAHLEISGLGGFVFCPGIFGDVEAGDADAAGGAATCISRVENGGGASSPLLPWALASKPTASTAESTSGSPTTCCDELGEVVAFGKVDGTKPTLCGVLETIGDHVADHDDGRAEDLSGGCGGKTTGPAPAT